MPTVPADTVFERLHWRFATKRFDPARKIPAEVWSQLERAMLLAPSSYGLQPYQFVVVTDPAVRAKLQAAGYGQAQIADASHLVVFCAKNPPTPDDVQRFVDRTAIARGVTADSLDGLKGMLLGSLSRMTPAAAHDWAARQCYIALGFFLTAAAMLGVDACPMEGFEPPKFDEILGLKEKGLGSVVIATAGYRGDDKYATAAKVRLSPEEGIIRV